MMNAAAGIFLAARRGSNWKNPYQTGDNALFTYVDGIWNAGGGVHNEELSLPVDIMNNVTFSKSGTLIIRDMCFEFDGNSTLMALDNTILESVMNSHATVMVGFRQDTFKNYNGMFRCAGARGLGYYSELRGNTGWTMSGLSWKGKSWPNPGGVFYTTNGQHYCFVGDGDRLSVWVNGEKAIDCTPSASSASLSNKLELGIGYNVKAKGRIYYLRFYTRSLTDAEIQKFTVTDISRFGSVLD